MKALGILFVGVFLLLLLAPETFAMAYNAGINGGIMFAIVIGVIVLACAVGTGDDRSDLY